MDQTVQLLDLPDIFTDSQYYKVEVKESKVPGAGMGLYATQPISGFEFICEYYGPVICKSLSYEKPFDMEDKMLALSDKYCVISRSPSCRANDIVEWDPQKFMSPQNKEARANKQNTLIKGMNRNASIRLVGKDKAFLMASRPIEKGQQIYIDYGFEYWEFFLQRHHLSNQTG